MPFNSIKQTITVYESATGAKAQALIEGTALLPGVTRSADILYTDAQAEIGSAEVQNDRLALQGTVTFNILYTGAEEKKAAGTSAQYAFSHTIDLKGAKPGMEVRVAPRVDSITAQASGSKASLRAVLTLDAAAFRSKSEQVLERLEAQQLYCKQKSVSVSKVLSKGEEKMLLEAEAELPFAVPAEEIVYSTHNVKTHSVSSYDGRLLVEGEVVLDAYCLIPLTDKPIAKARNSFPFEMQVGMEGLSAGKAVDLDIALSDVALSLTQPVGDAPKTLRVEGVLTAKAVAEETAYLPVLEDAYATSATTALLEKKVIPFKTGAYSQSGIDTIKLTFTLDEDLPKIGTLLACFARPIDYEIASQPKTSVAGALEVTVVYMPEEGELPLAAKQEVPFEASYDFALPQNAESKLAVRDADATLTASDQAELRVQLVLCAKADVIDRQELIVDAAEVPNALPENSAISIYFAKEGDTFWSVAKSFLTPIETLRRFNPDIVELKAGDRAILFRKGTGTKG